MGITALQAQSENLGATGVREYRGAVSASHFGDSRAELAALLEGCGICDLGFRAKISLTGSDRLRWLNGMVTNNVKDLADGHGVYAFLLNPQGHILGDLYAYRSGESILVDTDSSQVEKIFATFDHYIIMDDVEVKNRSPELTALGLCGPKSADILSAATFPVTEMSPLQAEPGSWIGIDCTLVRSDGELSPAYEIWMSPVNVRKAWDALLAGGATPVGSEALETYRVLSGTPLYGVDIRERDLPQETEQVRALNFNKGCYVGQEIVERIRSRGGVHRKFSGFLAEADPQIARGQKIVVGEKEVGELTSTATVHLPTTSKIVGLGYIRREAGAPGREVKIGTATATVVQLPVRQNMLSQDLSVGAQRPA